MNEYLKHIVKILWEIGASVANELPFSELQPGRDKIQNSLTKVYSHFLEDLIRI